MFRTAAEAEPPQPYESWLSEAERARLSALRFGKRRADWLRGRHAVKQAAAQVIADRWGESPALERLQVDADPSGAPFVRLAPEGSAFRGFMAEERLPVEVSLSHSCGAVLAVAGAAGEPPLGADLEHIEPRSHAFVSDFLAPEEIAACGERPDLGGLVPTAVWCAKEAVLKALRLGLTVDTRSVACALEHEPAPELPFVPQVKGWWRFHVLRAPRDAPSCGCWRIQAGFVQAFAMREAAWPRGGPA